MHVGKPVNMIKKPSAIHGQEVRREGLVIYN